MSIHNISSTDVQSLDLLKYRARQDENAALPEVAKQFEAVFLQSMLKSMRMGQIFLDENSPFKGKNEATFQDMLDAQYASNIAEGKGVGLAQMLAKQLQNKPEEIKAPAPIQTMANLSSVEKSPAQESVLASITQPASAPSSESPKSDMDEFIKSIWPYARKAASALGLDPKILMAQAVLETGWGQFVARDADGSTSNNLFNIKSAASKGDFVRVKTKEYIANTPITVQASFKKYPSVEHSFNDYVSLIKGSERYQQALEQVADPERFVQALHKAGYATDPNYSSKILSIYNGTELEQAMQRCGI